MESRIKNPQRISKQHLEKCVRLSNEDLEKLYVKFERSSTGPWTVVNPDNFCQGWGVGYCMTMGCPGDSGNVGVKVDGAEARPVGIETYYVHASEVDGDAMSDCEFIVLTRNNFLSLLNQALIGLQYAIKRGHSPASSLKEYKAEKPEKTSTNSDTKEEF